MKNKITISLKLTSIFMFLFVTNIFLVAGQLLRNGDFESGTGDLPEYWSSNYWQGNRSTFKWEKGTGMNGSNCISIENKMENDARWIQKVKLKSNTIYEFSGYLKGKNIQNHQNGSVFANLSILELLANEQVNLSDFNWTKVTCRFTTDEEGYYTLCARNGFFWNVTTGKSWFDNLNLKEIGKPELDTICGENIEMYLRDEDLRKISPENLQEWISNLDKVILKYEKLIGRRAKTGYPLRVLSVDYYPGGWAVAGNPIKWHEIYVGQELQRINDHGDWSFGIMHEISHNFDYHYWNFHGEHFANFKMFYAVETLDGKIWQNGKIIQGHDLKHYYKGVYDKVKQEYKETNNLSHLYGDALTYKFIDIADSIGWEPFKKAFRYYYNHTSEVPSFHSEKYVHFLDLLSRFSGKDVRKILSWGDRNEFVKYLGSTSYPEPVSSLKLKNRDCNEAVIKWKDMADNEDGFIVYCRTEDTWFTEIDRLPADTEEYAKPLHLDSTYYFRIRAYNAYGKSDYSLECKVDAMNAETPSFSMKKLLFREADSLNITWEVDTVPGDSIVWSFYFDEPDLKGDSVFKIRTSKEFNRRLKMMLYVRNRKKDVYYDLNTDLHLDPGDWKININSINSNDPSYPGFFQWKPMYHQDEPAWELDAKGVLKMYRSGKTIRISLSPSFYGILDARIQGTMDCGQVGPSQKIIVEIVPDVPKPQLSDHFIEICEGDSLPVVTANGDEITWYDSPPGFIIDKRDNQVYKTVKIFNRTWMAENLNYDVPGYSWYYNNDSLTYANSFGRLYDCKIAQEVCPQGTRLPSHDDWVSIPGNGGDLKQRGFKHWLPPNVGATDKYGFSALPGGWYDKEDEEFHRMGYFAGFWSHNCSFWILNNTNDLLFCGNREDGMANSVRCIVKNDGIIATGDSFKPVISEPGEYTFYATNWINEYESQYDSVLIRIKPLPPPPVTHHLEFCENETVGELRAEGQALSWYGNPELDELLHSGNSFTPETVKDTTDYFVTQTVGHCESEPGTVKVIALPAPVFDLGPDTSIELNGFLQFCWENESWEYLWNNGSSYSEIELKGTDLGEGEHKLWLSVTNNFGCRHLDSITVTIVDPLKTINPFLNFVQVHPNPADAKIYIQKPSDLKGMGIIKLLDCTGQIVFSAERFDFQGVNEKSMDISYLSKGCYLLVIEGSNKRWSNKIIVN